MHLCADIEALAVDTFDLQAVEETLCTGIVVAIAFAAHDATQSVIFQQPLKKAASGKCTLSTRPRQWKTGAAVTVPDTPPPL